jgi:hypothetical protein
MFTTFAAPETEVMKSSPVRPSNKVVTQSREMKAGKNTITESITSSPIGRPS